MASMFSETEGGFESKRFLMYEPIDEFIGIKNRIFGVFRQLLLCWDGSDCDYLMQEKAKVRGSGLISG